MASFSMQQRHFAFCLTKGIWSYESRYLYSELITRPNKEWANQRTNWPRNAIEMSWGYTCIREFRKRTKQQRRHLWIRLIKTKEFCLLIKNAETIYFNIEVSKIWRTYSQCSLYIAIIRDSIPMSWSWDSPKAVCTTFLIVWFICPFREVSIIVFRSFHQLPW